MEPAEQTVQRRVHLISCKSRDTEDEGLIPGLGRSPGGGSPLQDLCLGNPMDRGDWQATVQRVAKSQT